MNIEMIGIDHKLAALELREKLSFNTSKIKELLPRLQQTYGLAGIVVISTCNRTEFYLSYKDGQTHIDYCKMLNKISQTELFSSADSFHHRKNMEVVQYLFELASGIHSMIFGDDQIVSQIKTALKIANEVQSSDSVLNTLFRHAITCGKAVKSQVVIRAVSTSVATHCVDILQEFIKQQNGAKALVIGNGEIGQVVCRELINHGCQVMMTMRKYKHADVKIPKDCIVVDYYERAKYFEQVDIIISATASPHHTITYEMIDNLANKPKYMLDLAVPRDIELSIHSIAGIKCYDIDSIGQKALRDNSQELGQIANIVQEQLQKFREWLIFHKCARELVEVKALALNKITQNIDDNWDDAQKIEKAVYKTVEFIFYSMKEQKSKELLTGIKSFALSKGY